MTVDGVDLRAALRRRVSLGLVTASAALALGAGTAAAEAIVATGSGLGLKLNTSHVGYVSATLTGPAGTSVTLTEADAVSHAQLSTVTIPASGTLAVPNLAVDSCSTRIRAVSAATTSTTVAPATVTASVLTPKCTTRLDPTVPTSGRMGSTASITLGDRWRVGDLPVKVCVQPPGGSTTCSTDAIAAGKASRVVKLSLPRIGGWEVTTSVAGGRQHQTIVWASHPGPIRMLALGDSEMQVLDDDLASDLARYNVKVISDARQSTGLTNPFLYNWQSASAGLVANDHPDFSVVSMGANDGYSAGGIACCGGGWPAAYGDLVTKMARTLLQGQSARAYWFVLATPRPLDFQHTFDAVNAGIIDASHTLAGRMGLINARAYFTPGNIYRNYMTVNGQGFTIHESDGIHLNATADTYAAELVVHQLLADRVIR